jgi:YidC/Oxa1 family membrane protein insertase
LADFQNPQQEPGMERRLLLVFALTFVVIILFQPILKKYMPQTPAAPAQTQNQPQPTPPAALSPALQAAIGVPVNGATKHAANESETVVENDLYRITFTNRGGQVKSWILKKFENDYGKPLDLVNQIAAPKYGMPLSLWTYDEGFRNKINSALYLGSAEGVQRAPSTLTFEYADQDVTVRKTFRFDNTYVVGIETSVLSKGALVSAFPVWPAGLGDEVRPASYAAGQVEHQYNGTTERLAIKKIIGGNTLHGPFNWIGVTDQYFAAVFLPNDPVNATAVTLRNPVDIPKDWKNPTQDTVKTEVLGAAVGDLRGPTVEGLYVGPKALAVLEATPVPTISGAAQDLRSLVNFGFFGIIARPLFLWLKWTYEHIVGNWGWAIAIQTLIINLALLPLRISSMKSALKMQKVQPQMNAVREKYKKYSMRDPRKQEMNQEIAALMKKEGVNPTGGCLPLIIQMPFLFAYYSMLGSTLDLRHAHWLWIHDLSAPDPWYLLPIGIVISMFITQRMTPQAGMDPAQQKMMAFMMPVMIGVISFNLAAGLCLYWTEGNIIAIVQQSLMNRTSLGREMRELAAKRARKKDK